MQWEYAIEPIDNVEVNTRLRHVLNARGADGWELVSFAPVVKPVIGQLQGGGFLAVFKREGVGKFDPKIAEPPPAY